MARQIDQFKRGDRWAGSRARMNEVVQRSNDVGEIRGDGIIQVDRVPGGGYAISLNLAALLPRLPKPPAIRWFKGKQVSTYGPLNNTYIRCNPVDDRTGANPDTVQEVDIRLWRVGGQPIMVRSGELVLAARDNDGDKLAGEWQAVGSYTSAFFPVLVTMDGGAAGDKTTQCTYTYAATTLDGLVALGAGLTPKKTRPSVGKLAAPPNGSVGVGYYDLANNFALYDANETLAPKACP